MMLTVAFEKDLTRAAHRIHEAELTLESVDRVLRPGVIRPKNDAELAAVVGIATSRLQQVVHYIETGEVDLGLGDCPRCGGWGGWDDIPCGSCDGSGWVGGKSPEVR